MDLIRLKFASNQEVLTGGLESSMLKVLNQCRRQFCLFERKLRRNRTPTCKVRPRVYGFRRDLSGGLEQARRVVLFSRYRREVSLRIQSLLIGLKRSVWCSRGRFGHFLQTTSNWFNLEFMFIALWKQIES